MEVSLKKTQFLTISRNRIELERGRRNTRLLGEEEELQEFIDDF